jgi:uncharacterized protein YceK
MFRIVILLMFGSLLSGCGTFLNLAWFTPKEGGEHMYGGVRVDAQTAYRSLFHPEDNPYASTPERLWTAACLTADLPLSLVGDTLTLPWTCHQTLMREIADEYAEKDRRAKEAKLAELPREENAHPTPGSPP